MESYPGELLVGVFPLVFCVDATLPSKDDGVSSGRSQFDKFLDTIAASSSMVDDDDETIHDGGPMMQRVAQEQSDNEDEFLLKSNGSGGVDEFRLARRRSTGTEASLPGGQQPPTTPPKSPRPDRNGRQSPLLKTLNRMGSKRNMRRNNRNSGDFARGGDPASPHQVEIDFPPSFCEALQQGQSFFQRARIVSTSPRHGFPPSKDPSGQSNRVVALTGLMPGQLPPHQRQSQSQLQQKRQETLSRFKSAAEKRPIDGILPSGWLEKHAAALPSVIVVVAQIHPPHQETQQRQDDLLVEALENLQHSLAPKRKVDVKVVALVREGVSPILAEQWSQGILGRLPSFLRGDNADNAEHESLVTLVEEKELRSDDQGDNTNPVDVPEDSSSSALPLLHYSIRKSSIRYYKDRSREVKGKLLRLGGPQAAMTLSPALFPLVIRYCFKAAVFYEFQWKQEKSLKYMLEAYRLVETYYRYLLTVQHDKEIDAHNGNDDDQDTDAGNKHPDANPGPPPLPDISTTLSSASSEQVFDCGEGVEMSLPSTPPAVASAPSFSEEYYALARTTVVAEDMVHQCRALADWLNFKILQLCLVSHERTGMLAASVQWQRHSRAFCCPRRSFLHTEGAPWLDWSYASQQLLVVSQLLERHPPRALGRLGAPGSEEFDEDLLRCCSWRTYEGAAEALLKTGHRIKNSGEMGEPPSKESPETTSRIRYVGGLDHEGFRPLFQEESKKNHMELALNCALRGIALFENEVNQLKRDKTLIPWTRSGARLRYLAGGALLALGRHSEAIPHLEKAIGLCKGWDYLESLVRRLLIECFQNLGDLHTLSAGGDASSRQARTSFLLDCYFRAHLPADELSSALERLAETNVLDTVESGVKKCIRWNLGTGNDEMGSSSGLPFFFDLSFPACTHATAGQKVKAHVWIKSNLNYALCINSLSMLTLLGPLSIPSKDIPVGETGMVVVQPYEAIEFGTEVTLPGDLDPTATDGTSTVAGDTNAAVPNSSPVKAVTKPRLKTSGFSAGGGTRFVTENDVASEACLGGKTLRCDGISMLLAPLVPATGSSNSSTTNIELTIKLEEPEPPPNVRRSTFDHNNYLSSAWKRPACLSMNEGPTCLRVLPPSANMIVTNVTDELTKGTALEGTVNRIVLKLQAPDDEVCTNILVSLNCSSVLKTSEGATKLIVLNESDVDNDDQKDLEDMMNPRVRNPVLVKKNNASKTFMTDFGYILPDGWSAIGAGDGHGNTSDYKIEVSPLNAGEIGYAYFDIYRPTPDPTTVYGGVPRDMNLYDDYKCKTNIDVSIRYSQEGKGVIKEASRDRVGKDYVSLDHTVSLEWSSPLSVEFSTTAQDAYPSGNRHNSNILPENGSPKKQDLGLPVKETILIDNNRILTNGIMHSPASTAGLFVEVEKVQFVENDRDKNNCSFKLLSDNDSNGTIYKGEADHPSIKQGVGSKISFAWIAEACMEKQYREESFTLPLGTILVQWQPLPFELSKEVQFLQKDSFTGSHGPLKLHQPGTCRFNGPLCYIESAPFEAKPENLPDSIQVAVPFKVMYSIKNNTPLDQELEITLQDSSAPGDDQNDAFLISGHVNKRSSIGPFESFSFSYTAVPRKVGKVNLPSISISSLRYRSWVIRESLQRRLIYVEP
ncbi:unnamed protein product [Pseudo-nitzschia multistriata]|uniref:Trafficking protein particle complex subunit 11 domain-containing protein n=1 Tax=Pseudo-nitzschia multistriata TaxID=183589 RepID=A0A448ZRU8_9STRA|nr:unnamed protein product [Pseudo-nitzschia multistriata]